MAEVEANAAVESLVQTLRKARTGESDGAEQEAKK